MTLEEAFSQWEAGCTSYVACRRVLESAKSRIEILARTFSEEGDPWEPFESEERSQEGDAEDDVPGSGVPAEQDGR